MLLRLMAATGVFGMARSSKTRPERLLEHPTRKRIMLFLREHPGSPFARLCVALGFRRGTAEYHVRLLERAGYVSKVLQGRNLHYFDADLDLARRAQVAALAHERTRAVARLIALRPGIIQKEIGNSLALSRKVMRYYLDRLTEAGLVVEQRAWRRRSYRPGESLLAVLEDAAPEAEPFHPDALDGRGDKFVLPA